MEPEPTKRRTWLDKLLPPLRARVDAEIDCRQLSLGTIYRTYNLVRYCQPRTFRLYGGERRRRLAEYDARQRASVACAALTEQRRQEAASAPAVEADNA